MRPLQNGARRMPTELENQIDARLAAVETQQAVAAVHQVNAAKRLTAIEDTLKWLVRLVVGGVVLGFVSYALKGGITL